MPENSTKDTSQVEEKAENTFIPLTKKYLVHELLYEAREQKQLNPQELKLFQKLLKTLDRIFHLKFHQQSQELLEFYAPFCPDTETFQFKIPTAQEQQQYKATLLQRLDFLLAKANYFPLEANQQTQHKISSEHPLAEKVDLDSFEIFKVYTRSVKQKPSLLPSATPLEYSSDKYYGRVCLITQFKKNPHVEFRSNPYLNLKLFKDVPKNNLERLLPGTEAPSFAGKIRFLGWAAFGLFLYLKWGTPSQYVPELWATLCGLVLLCIYLSLKSFRRTQQNFSEINKNLYFSSIDNNFGVVHHLSHSAEEEEFKEAILVYYFLLTNPLYFNAETLQQKIEVWLKNNCKVDVNFDIQDAIEKLQELQILYYQNGAYLSVIDLNSALTKLSQDWNHSLQEAL